LMSPTLKGLTPSMIGKGAKIPTCNGLDVKVGPTPSSPYDISMVHENEHNTGLLIQKLPSTILQHSPTPKY
jgi:hypothetical protein